MMNDQSKYTKALEAHEKTTQPVVDDGDTSSVAMKEVAKEKDLSKKTHLSKGAFLKQTRERMGISLDLVHENTKIPLDALRAIEEGYTVRTLSEFYHKGFLKIYAKYLNVDVNEVIDDYRQEELPKHIKANVEDFDIKEWASKIFSKQRKQQFVILTGIFLSLFILFKVIGFFVNRDPKPRKIKETKTIEKNEVQKSEPVVTQRERRAPQEESNVQRAPSSRPARSAAVVRTAAPAVSTTPQKPASPVTTKNVTLTVRAKKSGWLSVKADGQVVFQSKLREGSVETWTADGGIEISGKNISQLEFELNGKMIGSLGRSDRKAKKVIVTKDGLTVTK